MRPSPLPDSCLIILPEDWKRATSDVFDLLLISIDALVDLVTMAAEAGDGGGRHVCTRCVLACVARSQIGMHIMSREEPFVINACLLVMLARPNK